MKSVALVGFASTTREGVFKSRADEIWTLNMALSSPVIQRVLPLEGVTRLFEIHYPGVIKDPNYSPSSGPEGHWKWLTENEHPYKVYMIEAYPEVHNVVKFPIDEVHREFGCNLLQMDGDGVYEEQDYITSSMGYMMALAILEEFDIIELYGIEMASGSEYFWQKPSGMYWIGIANGRGIKVLVHKDSRLISPLLYGYEAAEMVTQAQLETHMRVYRHQRDVLLGEINSRNASLRERQNNGEDVVELRQEVENQARHLLGLDYVLQFINKLVNQSQLEVVDPNLVNRFKWQDIRTS